MLGKNSLEFSLLYNRVKVRSPHKSLKNIRYNPGGRGVGGWEAS